MNNTVRQLFLGTVLLALIMVTVSANTIPVADFTATPTAGTSPLTVQFIDNSSGGNMTWWCWDFQTDGIIDSFEQNPVYTYSGIGNYSVNLTVHNDEGMTSNTLKEEYILVIPPAPVADFSAAPRNGTAPLTVHFTDLSTGSGTVFRGWDFNNDGIIDSTAQNPVYTYETPGIFSVNLMVIDQYGSDDETKYGYIVVSSIPAPVADFSAAPQAGTTPLTVQFTDMSTGIGITSWAWDFQNDGTIDSTAQNPAFTYVAGGTYPVRLMVTNAGGTTTTVKEGYITVTLPPVPNAQFTANPTSGKRPLTVQFTDMSTGIGITSWAWDFQNDGIIDSTAQNPVFTYTSRGYYTVKLTVTNAGGSSSSIRNDYIYVKR